jgi:hypothetical protein
LSIVGIQSAPESDNIRSPEFCRRRNPVAGILPAPESGGRNSAGAGFRRPELCRRRIPSPADQIPAGSGLILTDPAIIRPDLHGSGHWSGRIWPKRPGSGRIWTGPAIDPAGSGQNGRDPAGSGRIRPLIRPDPENSGLNPAILAGFGQTFSPESGNGDRTLPDSGDNYQTLIFAFRTFFVRTKHRKIFSRKSFFLKMISSKSFYDGNHFTSKQTEHTFPLDNSNKHSTEDKKLWRLTHVYH